VLREILRTHPRSIRDVDTNGWRPLHHAVHGEAPLEIVRLLVDAWEEALLERTDDDGSTPLHYAVSSRSGPFLEVLEFLVERRPHALRVKDTRGYLPRHVAARFKASAEVVQRLVERCPEALLIEDGAGWLPLHGAVDAWAPLAVIRCLVGAQPQALERQASPTGSLPLHLAASARAPTEVVRLLADADPHALAGRDRTGSLPLHLAVAAAAPSGSLKTVQLLIDKHPEALLEARHDGWLPLHVAARTASPELIRLVAVMGPDAVRVRECRGWLPLHAAACSRRPHVESVRALADAHPEALHARCNDGWLPLHLAVLYALVPADVVQFLADRGPRALIDKENLDGYTPLHLAARSRTVAAALGTVQCLLDAAPHALAEAVLHDGKLPGAARKSRRQSSKPSGTRTRTPMRRRIGGDGSRSALRRNAVHGTFCSSSSTKGRRPREREHTTDSRLCTLLRSIRLWTLSTTSSQRVPRRCSVCVGSGAPSRALEAVRTPPTHGRGARALQQHVRRCMMCVRSM
jgi:ankyrin repeat protein